MNPASNGNPSSVATASEQCQTSKSANSRMPPGFCRYWIAACREGIQLSSEFIASSCLCGSLAPFAGHESSENHSHLLLCPPMDYLWTPWRYKYVTGAEKTPGCIFCDVLKAGDDEKVRITYRGEHCFVILNTFPYTPGHVMIVPYDHLDDLRKLPTAAAQEMMALSQRMEGVLRDLYHPDGVNLGMNIGKAAGAGVAGHIHMHALPRWVADANFVSVIGESRVLRE